MPADETSIPELSPADRSTHWRERLAAQSSQDRAKLIAVALRILRDPSEAEDAVQDAMLSACRKIDDFRGDAQLSTWLHRIVVNAALMRLRSRRRHPEAAVDLDAVSPEQLPRTCTRSPEEQVAQKELGRKVGRCLERLAPESRRLLHQRFVEEIPYAVLAPRLGIKESGAKTRTHRAVLALRSLVDEALDAA